MDKNAFLQKYAGIYEHSPWIAEAAYDAGGDLKSAMRKAVEQGSYAQKLALIKAHPDLACAPAEVSKLTASSVLEQKGAGLNQCTPEEFAEFQKLNADYKAKFDFPFIIAVKGLTRTDILQAFRQRIHNSIDTEFETALEQIHKIAGFRIDALL